MQEYWAENDDLRFEFTLFNIEQGSAWTTRQYFSMWGPTSEGIREQNASWLIRWKSGSPPQIDWIGVEEFEQVESRNGRGRPLFSDITASALEHNSSYSEQFLYGMNHWLSRIEDTRPITWFGTPGLAVGDVNGDGRDDLYVCQEWGLPNRLFLQNSDGTATDVAEQAEVDWLPSSRSALLVDLDNDGDQDLVVAMVGAVVLAANDGFGGFSLQSVLSTSQDTMALSAADYDGDGDLDLYVGSYMADLVLGEKRPQHVSVPTPDFIYHDANDGARNTLFRNQGDWLFRDVTAQVGLEANNRKHTLAAAWEDYDNDGDQDLYVANDYGRNNLYRNDGGRFVDVATESGAEDRASGMSVSWADFDRDGLMDVYVSNMFSAAGNRVMSQSRFKPNLSDSERARFRHFAVGNTLLRNLGRNFGDVSQSAAVSMGRWAWSSNFLDVNNDGWEDLVVANGYMSTDDPGDL